LPRGLKAAAYSVVRYQAAAEAALATWCIWHRVNTTFVRQIADALNALYAFAARGPMQSLYGFLLSTTLRQGFRVSR